MNEVTGKIKLIRDTQQVSEKFQKREFVIESNENYPQTLLFELQGRNCDIIDSYSVGQEVVVSVEIRGRLWTNPEGVDKYFNTLVCYKIQPSNAPVGGNQPQVETKTNPKEFGVPLSGEEDELPF